MGKHHSMLIRTDTPPGETKTTGREIQTECDLVKDCLV